MELRELKAKSAALLDELADRLPPDQLKVLREYAFVGEWPMLANSLAADLVRRQVPVTGAERDTLREVLYAFKVPAPDYKFIDTRDEVIDALTIADS